MATRRIWGQAQRYAAMLVVWGCIGMLAGGLRYMARPATFEASTRLYIHHLGSGESGDFARNMGAIRSQAITSEAARRIRAESPFFLGKEQLTGKKILRALEVTPEDIGAPAEGLVTIRYQADSVEECELVLEAVVQSYLDMVRELQHPFTADFLEKLEYAQQQLLPLLRERDDEAGESPELPEWLAREVGSQAFEDQYVTLQRQIDQLDQRRARLEGELLGLDHAQSAGIDQSAVPPALAPSSPPSTPSPATPERPSSDTVAELRETMTAPIRQQVAELSRRFGPDHLQLKQARQKLEHMLSVFDDEPYLSRELVELLVELHVRSSQYGEGHPVIIDLKKQVDALRKQLRKEARENDPSQEVVTTRAAGPESPQSSREMVSAELPEGESPSETNSPYELRRSQVQAQLASVDSELKELRPLLERAHAQRLFQIVLSQLESIQWSRDRGGISVHVLDDSVEAREVSRSLLSYLMAGLAGGVAFGGVICLLIRATQRETP